MDKNPPTAADYAAAEARDNTIKNKNLESKIEKLEEAVGVIAKVIGGISKTQIVIAKNQNNIIKLMGLKDD